MTIVNRGQAEKKVMLRYNNNYAILALNCMLKSSKGQYHYQESREEIKTIVIKHIKLLKELS